MNSLYWLILIFLLVIIELVTINLTSLWFIIGAIFGYGLSVMGFSPIIQFTSFTIFSGVGIFIYKCIISSKINNKIVHTNFDRLIGKNGIVTITIDNEKCEGRILVNGEDWRAVSINSSIIEKGSMVVVQEIHSTRLYVKKREKKDND